MQAKNSRVMKWGRTCASSNGARVPNHKQTPVRGMLAHVYRPGFTGPHSRGDAAPDRRAGQPRWGDQPRVAGTAIWLFAVSLPSLLYQCGRGDAEAVRPSAEAGAGGV